MQPSSLAALLVCFLLGRMACASPVTTTNDSGPGSLRDTIAAAAPGDTVTFDAALNGGTILLTSGKIVVSNSLIIDGSMLPAGIIISGNTNSKVFETAASTTNEMRALRLTGGTGLGYYDPNRSGGGIYNYGTLRLSNVVFWGNSSWFGGGIYNSGGTVALERCTFSNNATVYGGGAIFNNGGIFALNNCIVCSNSADGWGGGGIYNANGSLVVSNTSVFRNLASLHSGEGGGLWNGEIMVIVNSTIASNAVQGSLGAGGGINSSDRNGGEQLTLIHCTVSGNSAESSGGGIYAKGLLVLENSVIAGNTASSNVNFFSPAMIFVGGNVTNGNPMLAPLADYGGLTPTMPLLPGSRAIERAQITTNTPAQDQRGAARPSGQYPDIGAVEAVAFCTIPLSDIDSDKIPDVLEGPGGPYPQFTLGVNDSRLDTDADGSPDWEELFNMTDLADPADNFRLLSITAATGFNAATNPVFDLKLRTFPGLQYQLLWADAGFNFQSASTSQLTATNFLETFRVRFPDGQAFLRAARE